jgi:hypothetical protein
MKNRTWLSILTYTSARILMFGVAVIVLYMVGARGILLLAVALFVSAIASYILLNKQRMLIADKLNGNLGKAGSKVTELRDRLEVGASVEDEEDEGSEEDSADASDGVVR